jgi:hypothetical protein
MPVNRFCGIKAMGRGLPIIEIIVAHPMVAKTGIPITMQIIKVRMSATELFLFHQ